MQIHFSKWILAFAAFVSLLWGLFDIHLHGHYRCDRIIDVVKAEMHKRSHLQDYMVPHDDEMGKPEVGMVTCECTADRKIRLTGKVVNDNVRQEFSDVASHVAGPEKIDNQIEVLNDGALAELQQLLASPPSNLNINYQIKDRGTILLSGDLPSEDMRDRIVGLVRKIHGVRGVVDRLGEKLETQRLLRVHNIYFDFNKWEIRQQSQHRVDEVAQEIGDFLSKNANGTIRVVGHTDSIADQKYNQWLSEQRAKAVVKALGERGVDVTRLVPSGKGETELLVSPDDTPEKRAENRRIDFYFQ